MAPPGNRRAGYSRKAHYGLFAGYVIAVAGAVIALLLLVTARVDPQGSNAIRALVADIASPISGTLAAMVRGVSGAWNGAAAYVEAGAQNNALRRERDANRRKLVEARALAYENARLRRLLGIAESGEAIVTGRLTSSSASSSRRFAMLDRGSGAGVELGMPVRGADGLVGRVVEVGLISARVQLVGDTGMVVPVVRVPDGMPAFVTGAGDGALDVRPLSPGANILKRGDLLVTSGAGGVYPTRVPVAVVTRVAGDRAWGKVLADPARLDYAVVLPAATAPMPPPPPREP